MMLRNLFGKVKHPQSIYSYHRGPQYNNGAQEMVFEKRWAYPIVVTQGAGQFAGQWMTRQKPQLRSHIALTPATLEGAGVRAGQISQQSLMDDSTPDANASIGYM